MSGEPNKSGNMRGKWSRGTALDRFEAHYIPEPNTGCWLWTGRLHGYGYSRFWVGNRQVPGHRWSYEHFIGPIPAGLQIDHKCRQPSCVNPRHLEPVTGYENLMRGDTQAARNKKKTHCRAGHPFDRVAVGGHRYCFECKKREARERYATNGERNTHRRRRQFFRELRVAIARDMLSRGYTLRDVARQFEIKTGCTVTTMLRKWDKE